MNKRTFHFNKFLAITCILFATFASDALAGSHRWFGHNDRIKGSGHLVTEDRSTEPFTALEVSGSFDLYVTIGKTQSLKVSFDDNLIKFVKTRVRNGRLKISVDKSYSSNSRNRVDIVVPTLDEIFCSGSGETEISGLHGDVFHYAVSGSGYLIVDGEIDELKITVSGSGDVDAHDLKARDARVRISGSGDVKLFASESIDGRVSGSGDILIYGHPEHVDIDVSGSGSIRHKR